MVVYKKSCHKEYMIVDFYDQICCLLGDSHRVYIIYNDFTVRSLPLSIEIAQEITRKFYFERINYYTIINTRYFQRVKSCRMLELKNGMKFKVSRRKWHLFKE
ncbi:hypothetical protein PGTDC60_1980 [Porphyromonas gingivalis TDC60]|uniref:HTH LytTR-type domain-containing protein n=2 Tax=Porphyromonas TaxID=836 RepID=A0A0A2FRZ0_9PORP|nr:hypothetical protein HR15_02025 [Porphyromonas gulae]OWR83184.1 hypothetical protein SJDPG12_02840 [Porphyromonas gingivalis SJD12]BAK26125.1 hypothetical protein PGTDC60_1980 [Porphyromonas gingivalis TDC60]